MGVGEKLDDRKSLEEVHGSVPVGHASPFKRLFAFMGPAYLVSVGYMDPGNWATDLEGGSRFGYALLWVLVMSNLMAVLLQTLSARLGIVTGFDLAQACRAEYSRPINAALWILAEVAIAACDLAEVLGTILALKLLFGMPLLWGCVVTALDTFLLLGIQRLGMRKMEAFILGLVATIGLCFLIEILFARPDFHALIQGFKPTLPRGEDGGIDGSLLVAMGILGATVMPHNLYLHSALVQSRRIGTDLESKKTACRYNLIDSTIALNAAFFVNAAILVLSASVFHLHGKQDIAGIQQAYELLPNFLQFQIPGIGRASSILFGIALLCAGQSSTLTGTLAGQIVMEGHIHLRMAPWLRRLTTRTIALVPAVLTIILSGDDAEGRSMQKLLVLSQVVLSLQLAFAVVPLIQFTSNRKHMGGFATPLWGRLLAWLVAAIIVGLNGKLMIDQVGRWTSELAESGLKFGPIPASYLLGIPLYTLMIAAGSLLAWIAVRPLVRHSPNWRRVPSVEIDWSDAFRPRSIGRIGIALEHKPTDSEIISRALSLARPGQTRLVLLHVADTPMSGVYGDDTLDRHTDADERYLHEVADALIRRGYEARPVLLQGPDRAGRLLGQLRNDPVDLLVVGSHGHGLVRDLLLGQTVDRVRHGLDIPVLITRPERSADSAERDGQGSSAITP